MAILHKEIKILFCRIELWLNLISKYQIVMGTLGGLLCAIFAIFSFGTFRRAINHGVEQWTHEYEKDSVIVETQLYPTLLYMFLLTCHVLLITWNLVQVRMGFYLTTAVEKKNAGMLKNWLKFNKVLIVMDIVRWLPLLILAPLFIQIRLATPLCALFLLSLFLSFSFTWIVHRFREERTPLKDRMANTEDQLTSL